MTTVKIKQETVIGETPEFDKVFFEYLDEYSITYKVLEEKGEFGYPLVEYEGGPISLGNMLREKFGLGVEDIAQNHPEIF